MSPKNVVTPLSAISRHTRTRGNDKKTPSQKLKENAAQTRDGCQVLEDMLDVDVEVIPET